MKILQVITRSELRGAEVFAAALSEHLAQRGHDVCLAALYSVPSPASLATKDVQRVEFDGKVKGRIEPRTWLRLLWLLRRLRPDVVQVNGFHALKYIALAKRTGCFRGALVYRNISIASGWVRGGVHRRWGRWLVRPVSYVASVSDASRADFIETYGVDPSRAITVRRGITASNGTPRAAARRRVCKLVGVESNAPLLFHIGGFTEEKNHGGLLAAFREAHAHFPQTHLVLCGDGPLRLDFERQVQTAGLADFVHCLGNRPDARELLAGADLLLLPSRIEGIPGVVLEAAVCKVPSICTEVGAVREAVENGKSGLLVPADDMAAFANAICELVADANRRRSLGDEAFRYVREHHGMQNAVDRFEDVYRKAIDGSGAC